MDNIRRNTSVDDSYLSFNEEFDINDNFKVKLYPYQKIFEEND